MPSYHFDINQSSRPTPIRQIETATIDTARDEAVRYMAAILSEQPSSFWSAQPLTLTVSDARHLTLFSIMVTTIDAPATARHGISAFSQEICGQGHQ